MSSGWKQNVGSTEKQDVNALKTSADRSAGQGQKPPASLPGFVFRECLGRGAFGQVWLAEQEKPSRLVAVKFFVGDRGLDHRLLDWEVKGLLAVQGERRVVHLIETGVVNDTPYFVMEYVAGGSLEDHLRKAGPPAVDVAVHWSREIAKALVFLHGNKLLHCDLKPSNVLIASPGDIRIADFGQARAAGRGGAVAGTLFYMAPEMAQPDAGADVTADIYSLGALMYAVLFGEPPHASAKSRERLSARSNAHERLALYRSIISDSPEPTAHGKRRDVDGMLANIVERCLRREPSERYQSAAQVVEALDARARVHARRPDVAVAVAVLVCLMIGAAAWDAWARRAEVARARTMAGQHILEVEKTSGAMFANWLDDRLTVAEEEVRFQASELGLRSLVTQHAGARDGERAEASSNIQRYVAGQLQTRAPDLRSWLVADREGDAIAYWKKLPKPGDRQIVGNQYCWREWFNGDRDIAADACLQPPTMRRELGTSRAYRSKLDNAVVFSVAAPIDRYPPSRSGDQAVGVLSASVEVMSAFRVLSEAFEGEVSGTKEGACPERFAVLIDPGGQVIRHPCVNEETLPLPQLAYVASPAVQSIYHASATASPKLFEDPRPRLTGEEPHQYFAAVQSTKVHPGWSVIVAHDAASTLRGFSGLDRSGVALILVVVGTAIAIGGMFILGWRPWYFDSRLAARPAPGVTMRSLDLFGSQRRR